MQLKVQNVEKTHKNHTCKGCNKKIRAGEKALVFVKEEIVVPFTSHTGQVFKDFHYFHNTNCLNEYEARTDKLPFAGDLPIQ